MNEEVKEIIDVTKELISVTKKAREQGIIGITHLNEAYIFEVEDFKTLVASATQKPVEKKRDSDSYPQEYTVEVDGVRFIHLSEESLQF